MTTDKLRAALAHVAVGRPCTMADLEALRDALRAALPPGVILDIVERADHVAVTAYDVTSPAHVCRATVPIVG